LSKIVVTGVAGFIGYETAKQLLADGHKVTGIDNFDETLNTSQIRRNKIKNFRDPLFNFIECNLLNFDYSKILSDTDAIYHFAATPGLTTSWTNFDRYNDNNILVSFRLAEAIQRFAPNCKIILASTSSVYGNLAVGDENIPIKPISPYGITKYASEQIFETLLRETGHELYILRLFSVFGPNQREDMAWQKIIRATLTGNEFPLTAQPNHVRSCTYVKDIAEFCSSLLNIQGRPGTYNICGDEEVNIIEGIKLIEKIMGRGLNVIESPARRGDQIQTLGDSRLAKEHLGFQPSTNFELGIRAQIRAVVD